MRMNEIGRSLSVLLSYITRFFCKMSQPYTIFGLRFAPLYIPFERRVQTFSVWQWLMTVLLVPILCTALLFGLLLTPLFFISIIYVCWIYFFDWKTPQSGGRRLKWVRNWKLWHYYRDYFPVGLVKTADLDPSKNYLIGYHPHGIIGCGAFCNFGTEANGFSERFPGIKPYLLTLRSQFYWPFLREYIMSVGMCDVTQRSIRWILGSETVGRAAIIVIGGAEEALLAKPGNYKLTLRHRKGFIRMAIMTGAQLVPCFSFGENDLFKQANNPEGSFLRRFQEFIKHLFGFSPPLFYGRGIFNYSLGIMPFRTPINTVVGAPIAVKQNPNPTPEEINETHQEYMKALSQLFDDHKTNYGISADKHIVFV